MPETELTLDPAAARSLAHWHGMVARRDLSRLPEIVAPEAVFRSPTLLRGFETAPALVMAIETVNTVLEDFACQREFATADGRSVVIEFSARLGDKRLKGIDMIRFGDDGRIVDFEVMVRPLNALKLLGEAMSARLGEALIAYKGAS
ncbi:nuclear transport factor 2 family protein [Amaricoccus sp. W119]|uniref:nuclear transport factor 2 family protein n=1 Tax=Amaricoccus sp. W119 TaxID=3391833 RepID=UPI0039A490BB